MSKLRSEINDSMSLEELNPLAQKYGFTLTSLSRGDDFKRMGNIADKYEIWFRSPSDVDYDHENDLPRKFDDIKIGIGGTPEEAIKEAVKYFETYHS